MMNIKNLLTRGSGIYAAILMLGIFIAWRLTEVPSRKEIAAIIFLAVVLPILKYPKFALYYLVIVPCFIPLFRRMYYLVSARPSIDYLMIITDGAIIILMLGLIALWLYNKARYKSSLSFFLLLFILLIILKIFISNGTLLDGFYGFKFNGIYMLLFYAGFSLLETKKEIHNFILISSVALFITALYSLKQIFIGYFGFEHKWLDSVAFTTIYIEGHIRTFSTYVSPAALSDAMNILLILCFYLLIHSNWRYKIYGFIAGAISIIPLLFATVRTNWMAAVLSLWLYFIFLRKITYLNIILNILLFSGALTYLVISSDVSSENERMLLNRQLNVEEANLTEIMIKNRTDAVLNPLNEYSFQKRMDTWYLIILDSYYKYPLGAGTGTTGYAHSYYFQILGELGYPGILLFILILFISIKAGFNAIKLEQDKERTNALRALFTVFLIISFLNLTGPHLNSHPADIFYWLALGIIAAADDKAKRVNSSKTLTANTKDTE